MKKLIFFIIILLVLVNRLAISGILTKARRKLPQYIDAQKRHSVGLSVPLIWAPEVKAWEDRVGLPLQGAADPNISIKQRSILGETETLPETAAILYFEDSNGVVYHLLPQAYEHIKEEHGIDNPSSFIQDVLLNPSKKVIENKDETKWAYYIKRSKERYEVVIVRIAGGEIETAYVSDEKPEREKF